VALACCKAADTAQLIRRATAHTKEALRVMSKAVLAMFVLKAVRVFLPYALFSGKLDSGASNGYSGHLELIQTLE